MTENNTKKTSCPDCAADLRVFGRVDPLAHEEAEVLLTDCDINNPAEEERLCGRPAGRPGTGDLCGHLEGHHGNCEWVP